jgi:hypothetical protein
LRAQIHADQRQSAVFTIGKIFPDQAMTLAAIDRLVHHSMILEMNVESYRRRDALDRKRGRGRSPTHTTINQIENAEN